MEVVEINKDHISFTMENIINDQAKKGLAKIGECTGYTQKNLLKISKVLNSIFLTATKEEQEFFKIRDGLIVKDENGKPTINEKGEYIYADQTAGQKAYYEFLKKTHTIPFKKIDLYDVMPAGISPHDIISLSFLIQE
jgi:hypothetical protein